MNERFGENLIWNLDPYMLLLLVGPTYLFFTPVWTVPQLQRRKLATASATKCAKNKIENTRQIKHHHQSKKKKAKPSPTHHQNITAPSPHITGTSPKRARDVTNTSLKDPKKHHQKTNKTTPKQHRDITKKRQRQDQDKTET